MIHRDAAAAGAPVSYRLGVVGASAGGLSALATMLGQLPQDFPLPVAIVQHVDPNHESLLASILSRRTALKVTDARDHEAMISGRVYVAPPGTHMMVAPGIAVHLTRSAPVHFVRPSADVLFESAACAPA